jgi:hypothetical protein
MERRYAENPQGLTFAPLAEVHRKNGDVARALELLRAGLELHPNYIPASIVLGRCHWDLGDLPAAESAFAHVLRLDDENVIALKSLADINERLERFSEAQRWLHRLVSVDRSNEEARQQLSRLESMKASGDKAGAKKASPGPSVELPPAMAAVERAPSAASAGPPAPSSPTPPASSSAAPPAPTPAQPAASSASPSRAPNVPDVNLTTSAEPPGPAKASEPARDETVPKSGELQFLDTLGPAGKTSEPSPVPEEPAPLPGLISQEFEPPKEAFRLHPELTQFDAPPRPPNQLDVELTEEVELRSSGADEFRMPNAAEDFMDVAAQMSPARDEPPRATASPSPVEREQPPPPVQPPPAPVPEARAPAETAPAPRVEAAKPSYSARDTKGQSVASFFQSLLAARPAGNSRPPTESNSAVAPDTAPTQDSPAPSAELGETAPAAAASPGKDGPVSFDDFFGPSAGATPAQPQGSTESGKDDLDQFQSWLQNLKR